MFTSLVAAAPAFHGGVALLPLFIIGHVFWFFILVLFIVFAIAGASRRRRWVRAGGFAGHFGPWAGGSHGAEATLAERFAQGDIDEKEYRARLEVLRANNTPRFPGK